MLLSVSFSSCIRFTVLFLQTLAKCPVFLQILHDVISMLEKYVPASSLAFHKNGSSGLTTFFLVGVKRSSLPCLPGKGNLFSVGRAVGGDSSRLSVLLLFVYILAVVVV